MEIDNYPDYLIYPNGKVFSKKRNKEMKPFTNKAGYQRISLWKNGKEKKFYIHRLIGIHHIPNPENKPTIDHINRIRDDNRLENLRWATSKEQSENQEKHFIRKDNTSGHRGISFHKSINRWVYVKRDKYKIHKSFESKTDALCFKYIYLLKIKSK